MIDPNKLSATPEKLVPFYHHIKQRIGPITLTVLPTTLCNAFCEFCSNHEDRKHPRELSIKTILETLDTFPSIRAVEISGGGDPTMYSQINLLIYILHRMRYRLGFITNGINIENLTPYSILMLDWIRVSVNPLIDHQTPVNWEYLQHAKYLGITYIHHKESPRDYFNRLDCLKSVPFIKYCKICNDSYNTTHETASIMDSDGWMYSYDHAWEPPGDACYCGSVKPVLATNGFLYPCASIVLHDGMYHADDFIDPKDIQQYKPYKCTKPGCPFVDRNKAIHKILTETDQFWEFV